MIVQELTRKSDTAHRAPPRASMPRMLASIATLDEVEDALTCGADLIDLKDPSRGALGAWAAGLLGAAVSAVGGRRPVSATVGDLPPEASHLAAVARRTASAGVDIIKLGFLAGADHRSLALELAPVAGDGLRLVAVLMADQDPDLVYLRPWRRPDSRRDAGHRRQEGGRPAKTSGRAGVGRVRAGSASAWTVLRPCRLAACRRHRPVGVLATRLSGVSRRLVRRRSDRRTGCRLRSTGAEALDNAAAAAVGQIR